jgi:hypothetical protein
MRKPVRLIHAGKADSENDFVSKRPAPLNTRTAMSSGSQLTGSRRELTGLPNVISDASPFDSRYAAVW